MAVRIILAHLIFCFAVGDPAASCSGFACEEDAMKVELLQTKTQLKRESMAAELKSKAESASLQTESEFSLYEVTEEQLSKLPKKSQFVNRTSVSVKVPKNLQPITQAELLALNLTTYDGGEKKVNRAEVQTESASLSSFRSYLEEHMNFENQSMMEAFVTEHASTWRQLESNSSLEARGVRSLLSMSRAGSQRSVCALKYTNKYFLPKLNLCANSFTGLTGCTEGGCYALSAVFYSSYCYTAYYSNAESKESGYGMCRCLNNYNYNLYDSGAGNNIYSCSSVLQ